MKSRAFKSFLAVNVLFLLTAGIAAQGAQPENAQDIYAAAGTHIYRINALTGENEEEGSCYDPVIDVMKTENGLYGETGEPDDYSFTLRSFSDGNDEYIGYDVTDMVGERDGKFYYLKNWIGSGNRLYAYDPKTGDSQQAITPEVISAETDGELLYASLNIEDDNHPDGVCRIGYGPSKETGNWSVLGVPEDGAEYLPELVKGKDGVYFLYRSSDESQEEGKVSVSLMKFEYAEPHNCVTVADFNMPVDGKARLIGATDAAAVLEYQDDNCREAYILRLEDGMVLQFGTLDPEEEFPPIISSGDDFYTIFGENVLYLVDPEANGKEIMVLPADAKLWSVDGGKAVYSLNGSLFLADSEDVREEQEDSLADTSAGPSKQAAEELSKALLQYWEYAKTPSVFYSKLKEDPLAALLLKETEGSFAVSADLQVDPDGEGYPVKAQIHTEKEESGYIISGSISLSIAENMEDVDFTLDTNSGSLELKMGGQSENLNLSSAKTMLEALLPGFNTEEATETSEEEKLLHFMEAWNVSSEKSTFSYSDFIEGKQKDISEPCTVYKAQIGWDEVLKILLAYADKIETIYSSVKDFQTEFFGYGPSYDSGFSIRESVESFISQMKKYSSEGIELSFSVTEDELVAVSLSAQTTEASFEARSPEEKPLNTIKIGEETAPAGLLVEGDLKRKTPIERDGFEVIWSLPMMVTMSAVNNSGDEDKEFMGLNMSEAKEQDSISERWKRGISFYSSYRDYSIAQTYTPGTGEDLPSSYTMMINTGRSYLGLSDNYTYIFLREAPDQDAEGGAALSISIKAGDKEVANGTIQVKGD